MSAMETVKKARMVTRPTTLDWIANIFTDFIELHGDRQFADDPAVVGGIARLGDTPITVIGIQKGKSISENIDRHFGSPSPEGYRKQLRLMHQAEKFGRPIVLFVNTSGAYCGVGAEERGQGEAIARNLMEMAGLTVPIISIFVGEGGSGGALAMALADQVWMLTHGMYAVLSPEGFASILWRSPEKAAEAAELMRLTAPDLLEQGIIDTIIPEPAEGLEQNISFTADIIKEKLMIELQALSAYPTEMLLSKRYDRFRKFGDFS